MTLLTYSRRLTASIAALALSRHSLDAWEIAGLSPFADGVRRGLGDLGQALSEGRSPLAFQEVRLPIDASPLLQGRATRLARQLRSLHDAVERWQGRLGQVEREGPQEAGRARGARVTLLENPGRRWYTSRPKPCDPGQVSEWLKEPVSKTGIPARVSRVRIPPCPFHVAARVVLSALEAYFAPSCIVQRDRLTPPAPPSDSPRTPSARSPPAP